MLGPPLRSVETLRGPSVADLVFEELYRGIVELRLPPGARLSEQEVARQVGVSRQPVRDAFWRLSKLGLVQIQPQRATTVTLISEEAVMQARFVRAAIETETARAAARAPEAGSLAELASLIDAQRAAVAADDRVGFHALDDAFHQAICAAAGNDFVWSLIRDNKAHMDRVRWLSLGSGAGTAFDDHLRIFDALRVGDAERAAAEMRAHLGRIVEIVARIRAEHPEMLAAGRA